MDKKSISRKKKVAATGNTGELRRRAEDLLQNGKAGRRQVKLADMKEMLHELQVHQVELELQNQELMRAQVEADVAREKYFDLYDMAPVAYCTLDESAIILEINLTGTQLLGKLRSALVGNNIKFFVYREDVPVFAGFLERIFSKGDRETCEIRLDRDGTPGPLVRIDGALKDGRDGNAPQCRIIATDITALKRAENDVRRMLGEKELLIREIHHRVKNNMMIVSSILSLQSQYIDNPQAKKILEESRDRVHSMQIIYDKLYRSGDVTHVSLQSFLTDLAESLLSTYSLQPGNIRLEVDVQDVRLETRIAVSLGIIINELVTNSIKYAFPDNRNGRIGIRLSAGEGSNSSPGTITMIISDDGIGIAPDFEPDKAATFGMTLIGILVKQLNGTIMVTVHNGTQYRLNFNPGPT